MRIYHLFSKSMAGVLALTCAVSGCTPVETEDTQTVPLSLTATFPAYTADGTTRAANPQVQIALNATGGAYAAVSKTYTVTSSSPSITFAPDGESNTLQVSGEVTSTPLTIYGWLDENTPVYYSNSNIAVNNGAISNIKLAPAYSCIGVRILKDRQTETAGLYTIESTALQGIGTSTTNGGWNTTQQKPQLNAYITPSGIKNTDKTTVVSSSASQITSEYFMRVLPGSIGASSELFSITLPGGNKLSVPNQAIEIKLGYCYLFTVNISRNTTVEVSDIQPIPMNELEYITVDDPSDDRAKKGIHTPDDLKKFRDAWNDYGNIDQWAYTNEHGEYEINLEVDIDLKNEEWGPIGKDGREFTGKFYGNGHTIYNLYVPLMSRDYGGFFGVVRGGTIKGLTINTAKIGLGYYAASYDVGAIAAVVDNGTIIDCHVKGNVQIYGEGRAGGIVGYFIDSEHRIDEHQIVACTVETDASSLIDAPTAGGIAAKMDYGLMAACIAHDITFTQGSTSNIQRVGGLIGEESGSNVYNCMVYNCTAASGNYSYQNDGSYPSYYYNVFDFPPDMGPEILSSLEALSGESVIYPLNYFLTEDQYMRGLMLIEVRYKASAHPTRSGPVLETGPVSPYAL